MSEEYFTLGYNPFGCVITGDSSTPYLDAHDILAAMFVASRIETCKTKAEAIDIQIIGYKFANAFLSTKEQAKKQVLGGEK